MINLLRRYKHAYTLKKGLKQFEKNRKTTAEAYHSLRQMFVLTRGKSNDNISEAISKKVGQYNNIETKGILGDLTNAQLSTMVGKMQHDGYFIFDAVLPQHIVDEIYNYALKEPVSYLNVVTGKYGDEKVVFDPQSAISPRYEFSGESIVKSSALQSLIFDQTLLAFAQKYLGVKPILDLVAFWWSAPFNGEGKSAAAQMYHFDMDRIKFLKFFFYITDVDTDTGPHCYVKGSHKFLPSSLSRDGRFTDGEIEAVYGKENMIEICGKRGTIMAVDTRGFHKGKELSKDNRLLFQIEFANSMFGQTYPPISIKFANNNIKSIASKYPYTYNEILKSEK